MIDLAANGFEIIADRDPNAPVRVSETLAVDLSSRHDVDLVDHGGRMVAGAVFEDPHQENWWAPIHEQGQLTVFVGSDDPFRLSKPITKEWARSAYIVVLRLIVKAWNDGIGTARPGPS